jgi:hypothetical protein
MSEETQEKGNTRMDLLEQRVEAIESVIKSHFGDVKKFAENSTSIAAALKVHKKTNDVAVQLQETVDLFFDVLDQLGRGGVALDAKLQAMLRYLAEFEAPANQSAKEIFLETLARQEDVTEHFQNMIALTKLEREARKRKNPPQNPPDNPPGS